MGRASRRTTADEQRPSPAQVDARTGRGGWRPLALAILLVSALVAAAHWPVLRGQAVALDDNVFVTNNALVTQPGWASAWRFFSEVLNPSSVSAYYLPLSMTSLMLDYALGGRPDDQRVFHRTNLALHVLDTVLILLLLHQLFGALLPAAAAALLFGLHPLMVEPVASIGERKTLLAAFFALACLVCYVRYCRRGGRSSLLASVGLFLLALLSKPSVTTLPLLLLLLDLWPLRRLSWSAVLEKWPFLLLSAASGAITIVAVARTWEFGALPEVSLLHTFLQVCYLLAFYLGKILWPVDLSCVYAPPAAFAFSNPVVLVSVLAVCGLTVLLVLAARRTWAPLVAWAFFVVALAPTFGILRWSVAIAYDRYLYFPALGIVLLLGAALAGAWRWSALRGVASKAGLLVLVLGLAAAEARGLRSTLRNWEDSLALWRHIARVAPGTPDAHNGLGVVLEGRGEHEQAIAAFRRAIAVGPNYADAHSNLGVVLNQVGQVEEAIQELWWASAHQPGSAQAAFQLGLALQHAGRLDEAAGQFQRALGIRPGYIVAIEQLGIVRVLQGHAKQGIALLRSALELAPSDARARFGLAVALRQVGGSDEEVRDLLRQAIRLRPGWAAPCNELAWQLATNPDPASRDTAEALRLAERAVELTSRRDPTMLDTQAAAQAAAGRFDQAVRSARSALELAVRSNEDSLVGVIRARLALYGRRTPYTEVRAAAGEAARGR